jgi:hypothetical protein
MRPSKNLFERVVTVSNEYLGPAAERFIRRQILTHLDKEPDKLMPKDLPKLIAWVKPTFALLTDNQALVEAFASDLFALTQSNRRINSHNGAQK